MIEILEQYVKAAFKALGYDGNYGNVVNSNRPELCDYQCNDLFTVSKAYKKAPATVGMEIVEYIKNMDTYNEFFNNIEFVNPGFINITVSDKLVANDLNKRLTTEKLGIESPSEPKTYFIDYGGPNVAKPLHVGHLRPAIIGESLKRIIKFLGHKTISDVHLGDYGLQIGQVILGLQEEYPQVKNYEELFFTIEDLERIYPAMSKKCKENKDILEQARNITKSLQDGDQKYLQLWKLICEVSINDIKRLYRMLDVDFDLWNGESDSYPYIPQVVNQLATKELVELDNGAQIIRVQEPEDKKEIPPFILAKSDGAYLYSTTDLASIYERVEKYHPDYILYVVDARQSLHFEQVFRVAKRSGIAGNSELEHIGFGTMNGEDGKPFKTRSGEMLKLEELFDLVKTNFISKNEKNTEFDEDDLLKITNAIIKFADLHMYREKNYIFSIDKFSSVNGKTGPYILYTYLRINKILEKINLSNYKISDAPLNDTEQELRKKLINLETALNNALSSRSPHFVSEYLYDICVTVNAIYQNFHITSMDASIERDSLVSILYLTNKIIKNLLQLLIIDIPKKM